MLPVTELPAGKLPDSLLQQDDIDVRAVFVGEHIDIRRFTTPDRLGTHPLVIPVGEDSAAVLFRYGAVVLFNGSRESEGALLREVTPFVRQPFAVPQTEQITLQVVDENERIEGDTVFLRELSVERLQVVASVLSKSVVLAEYESRVSANFDRVEPFAAELHEHGRGGRQMKSLLRHIGDVLRAEHKMVGRVEMHEKPDLLWDHPELKPLYSRLEDEFEIVERYTALERKLALMSRTVSTVLELLQNSRTLRVEWYIVILIVLEILLTLYELFWHV